MSPASDTCQRWQHGQHSWRRPADGGFNARRFAVHPVAGQPGLVTAPVAA